VGLIVISLVGIYPSETLETAANNHFWPRISDDFGCDPIDDCRTSVFKKTGSGDVFRSQGWLSNVKRRFLGSDLPNLHKTNEYTLPERA
jgi:hypothetical protein